MFLLLLFTTTSDFLFVQIRVKTAVVQAVPLFWRLRFVYRTETSKFQPLFGFCSEHVRVKVLGGLHVALIEDRIN